MAQCKYASIIIIIIIIVSDRHCVCEQLVVYFVLHDLICLIFLSLLKRLIPALYSYVTHFHVDMRPHIAFVVGPHPAVSKTNGRFFFTNSDSNNVFLSVLMRQLITYAKCCAFVLSGIMIFCVVSDSLKLYYEKATKMAGQLSCLISNIYKFVLKRYKCLS